MANSDIKQKIVLEGEKEYRNAIKEAQRNLKTLRSELKAETAELGANATAQQKNELRIKSLQKQIKEQEKVVKANRDALKEVREKYGDNEEALAKYEQKLNESRAALASMKNELENVGKGFDQVKGSAEMATVASKSVADSIGSISEVAGSISDSIESVFTGLLDTLKSVIGEVWSMIADTAAKANNWTDLASYYGTTASAIERMNAAIEMSQGDFGAFTNLLNQLSWGGKGKKITEWFGVSDVNYENKLDYAMAVLQKMQDMSKTDPGKLGDAMEDVFGARKSQQIMWFVSNLDKINENLANYDQVGYGLGEDVLSTMNDVWFELGEIETKWDKLKQKFAGGFGQVTLDVLTNVSGALDALATYFNAETDEEREQALQDLEDNITAAFKRIGEAITEGIKILNEVAENLKKSDDPVVRTIGELMSGLASALEWFTADNMANVISALETLAAFWLVGKGLQLAGTVASLAANIRTISLFKTLGGGGLFGGAGATISTGLTVNEVTAAVTAAAGPLASAIAGLTMSVGVVTLAVPVVSALIDVIKGQWPDWLPNPNKSTGETLLPNADTATQEALTKALEQTSPEAVVKTMTTPLKDTIGQLLGSPAEQVAKEKATTSGETSKEAALAVLDKMSNNWLSDMKDTIVNSWLWNGQNTVDFWANIIETLKHAEEYAEEVEEELNQYDTERQGPDENWVFPDSWGIDEIMEWVNRNSSSGKDSGGNSGNTDGMTSTDAKDMTGAIKLMPNAVARGISNIRVYLDGANVGRLVAPYVSQEIAQSIG